MPVPRPSDVWMQTRDRSPVVGMIGDTFRGLPMVTRIRRYATSADPPAFDNFPNLNRIRNAVQQIGKPAPEPEPVPAPTAVRAMGEGSRVINAVSARSNRRVLTV